MSVAGLVLAAGKSTRMKSRTSKVLHRIAGREILFSVLEAARGCQADPVVCVRGPDQLDIAAFLEREGVRDVVQTEALGTAHAVMAAEQALQDVSGSVLILCGDVPLIRAETLTAFISAVQEAQATLGVLTMTPPDPEPYGRIVRDGSGRISRIVESRDATQEERGICEVNSGILCADRDWLFQALKKVGNANAKSEYYLTDLVNIAYQEGVKVLAHLGKHPEEFLGVNSRIELARAAELMRERINKGHQLEGVGILDYRHTYVDADVHIGAETTVFPFSFLLGKTTIGEGSTIENGVVLRDAVIGNNVHVKAHSVIEESTVEDDAVLGPFARVRPASQVGKGARVGNFVELKKTTMKEGAKANHLTYLGDATIGAHANIGCGTITCNYDGEKKHQTIIGDHAFIGSDTQFVAPVTVGRGAMIGAGSTITDDVPEDALALSRSQQRVLRGWMKRKKTKES